MSTYTVEKWVDLLKGAGVTKEDMEPIGNRYATDDVIIAHIKGPTVFAHERRKRELQPDGYDPWVIVMPEGWEPPTEEEWLEIEKAYGIERNLDPEEWADLCSK